MTPSLMRCLVVASVQQLQRLLSLKALRSLKRYLKKVSQINADLSAIDVKLGHAETDRAIILKHERKIAALESRLFNTSSL